jgi:tRNA U34 5-methylaminomethyl-2-thiouridine-forming methyltransferase MnmC
MSAPHPTTVLPVIQDTILARLTPLFLAGADNDMAAARQAAIHMLASYNPQTENELRLAASVISFSLHALEALSQAATPDMPMNKILRLRSGAVSLNRASDNAERRLEQLRKARQDSTEPQSIEAEPIAPPQAEKAIALVEATRPQIQALTKNSPPVWSKAYQQQQAARRITENLRQNQAAHQASTPTPTT